VKQPIDRINVQYLRWLAACYLCVLLAVGLLIEGVLKEMPLFWQNRGGYSIALRQWVLYSFYPSFFLLTACLAYLSFGMNRHAKTIRQHPISALLPVGLAWLLMGATGVVVVIDNLENLFKGAPLHSG
jgi:hypothetical protein